MEFDFYTMLFAVTFGAFLICLAITLIQRAQDNNVLKQCRADGSEKTDTFTHRGVRYDREKYISLRVDKLLARATMHKKELQRRLDRAREKLYGENACELDKIEVEVYKRALACKEK